MATGLFRAVNIKHDLAIILGLALGCIGIAAFSAMPSEAQQNRQLAVSQRPIRVEVPLVLTPVTVVDEYNRFVAGLEAEQFRIFEDRKEQTIQHFHSEDAPLSIGILFDASESMANKLERAHMAVMQFVRSSNPRDEFFLIGFNDRPCRRINRVQKALWCF